MKKTHLKNGGIAVHRLASCIFFTLFVFVAPHVEYFKVINNNLDLLLTVIGVTTALSWILILTVPTQGFPFFIEISDKGITQRWFGKIQATIDWSNVERIERVSSAFLAFHSKDQNQKPVCVAFSKKIKDDILLLCPERLKESVSALN